MKSSKSFSHCSFESDNDLVSHEDPTYTSTPYNSYILLITRHLGRLKQNTVCCQTLKYWYTCCEEKDD